MKQYATFFLGVLCLCFMSCIQATKAEKEVTKAPIKIEIDPAKRLDELSLRMVSYLEDIPLDSTEIPRTYEKGKLVGTKSKSWTSGFFPGLLWNLYDYSKKHELKDAAIKWQSFVEKEKYDGGTHDLGFKVYCPFGNAYEITGDEMYRDVFVTAAKTLITRYDENIKALRSWDHHADVWQYPVIIDNMMNLEMLFETTIETGDSIYHNIAEQHALTTLQNHFRDDHSSYHVVSYDTLSAKIEMKNTHQGFSHESAWSRGQAWGLYGYAVAYKYTGRKEFLAQANNIADYIFSHPNLPADLIPYWDYNAPDIPNEPRDVSAAAVTASGLFALSKLVDNTKREKYRNLANELLSNLSKEEYQLNVAPFFLKHSVGSIPGKFEVDAPIIYSEYYYVEALKRSLESKSL